LLFKGKLKNSNKVFLSLACILEYQILLVEVIDQQIVIYKETSTTSFISNRNSIFIPFIKNVINEQVKTKLVRGKNLDEPFFFFFFFFLILNDSDNCPLTLTQALKDKYKFSKKKKKKL